jgi:predicted kinase
VTSPTLVVVSGPPGGFGKTTLAHEIARAVGCPPICRDELKEGMVHAHPGFEPAPGDPLTLRTFSLFFDVLALLLGAGVTVVAEAAFQGSVWRPGLERLAELAELRVVQCIVDPGIAHARNVRRAAADPLRAKAHGVRSAQRPAPPSSSAYSYDPISMGVPVLQVETTDGYRPALADIVAFVNR